MESTESTFAWTEDRARAAVLVAEDEKTDMQISAEIGIGRTTLARWKNNPEFRARVEQHVEEVRQSLLAVSIAHHEHRINRLNDRWKRIHQVIDERAADPAMENVPGGKTGLIVRSVKGIGKGDDFQLIDLYMVDTGLLREAREIEKQAAIERGQWSENLNLTDSTAENLGLGNLNPQQLGALLTEAAASFGSGDLAGSVSP